MHFVFNFDEARDQDATLAGFNAEQTRWWAVTDSNRRHPACKAGALPTELTALGGGFSKNPLDGQSGPRTS